MANRFWIGGLGNWTDTAHWSTSSGGSGGASVPTASDDVVFDANSFSSPTTIYIDSAGAICKTFDSSGVTHRLDVTTPGGIQSIQIRGNVSLGKTWFSNSVYVYLAFATLSVTTDNTVLAGNYTDTSVVNSRFYFLVLAADATTNVTFSSIVYVYSDIYVGFGTLNTNGYGVCASIRVLPGATLNLGSSTINAYRFEIFTGAVFNAGTSTIRLDRVSVDAHFWGDGRSFNKLIIDGTGAVVYGSNTFTTIENEAASQLYLEAGKTQTITNFNIAGSLGSPFKIHSLTSGSTSSLSKSSGTVNANFVDLKDNTATGGATWNASPGSVDGGNNVGWNFQGNLYPSSIVSAEVFGTAAINLPPIDILPTSIASAEAFGTLLLTLYLSALGGIATEEDVDEPTLTQSDPPPPPPTDWSAIGKEDEKVYIYKVFTASGTYIGVWNDVEDDPQFTQQINTPGTTMTVLLARSPNTTKEVRAHLLTQGGDPITTEDGHRLTAVYETPNSVGEGTDVDLNYRVDVYVHYGEFGRLLNQLGEPITTEDGDYLLVTQGAPLGVRIFSGFIIDYESEYGDQAGVSVTVASHGWELSHEVVRSGETTTVTYSTTEIKEIVEDVLDTNPGVMTYDTASIGTTGISPTLKFQLNTKLEAIQAAYDQTPDGWYWYGNVAENLIYMKPTASTKQHTFVLGKHIKSLKVKRSIENLVNKVYFVGGEVTPGTPSTTLYKKYQDTTSQTNWRVGLARITDRRFTIEANAARKASKQISRYKDPIFTSPLVISSARYDIESIKLGETVGFANFGNFVDSLPPLQIVALSYAPTAVTLQLGEVQKSQMDMITDVENDLSNEQYQDLPTTPS